MIGSVIDILSAGFVAKVETESATEEKLSEPNPLKQIQQLWTKLSPDERKTHLEWTLNHCATCGREGKWEGGERILVRCLL